MDLVRSNWVNGKDLDAESAQIKIALTAKSYIPFSFAISRAFNPINFEENSVAIFCSFSSE